MHVRGATQSIYSNSPTFPAFPCRLDSVCVKGAWELIDWGVYVRSERNLVQLYTVSKREITYTCVLDKLEHGTSNSYTPKDHVGTYRY
jgi:hypothetical protein